MQITIIMTTEDELLKRMGVGQALSTELLRLMQKLIRKFRIAKVTELRITVGGTTQATALGYPTAPGGEVTRSYVEDGTSGPIITKLPGRE